MIHICLTSVNGITTDADILDTLLEQIANGNSQALEHLYNKTQSAVYSFTLSILKNTHDAEDVLHDCFLNIWNNAETYRSNRKPMAWIMTIAKNLCYMKLRTYKRQADLPEEDWMPYLEKQTGISTEDRMILTECMTALTEEERKIVVLHAVSGFKHREIAELLEMPLATVLSKYSRAIKKLQNVLQ